MSIIETTKADYKKIVDMLPALNEYQARKIKDKWTERLIYFILGVLLTFLGTVATNYYNII